MSGVKKINQQRMQRKRRTRACIVGTSSRPRLSIFRSNTRVSVQLIDDAAGKTLIAAHSKKSVKASEALGAKVAHEAKKAGIEKAVFDRGAYQYHGNVKAVAESARSAGLKI